MGKRLRGAALRAKKRGQQAAQELLETNANLVETQHVTNQTNDELFILDTTAILPSKKQLEKKEKKNKRKQQHELPSSKEQTQIKQLINKHSPKVLQQMVNDGKKNFTKKTRPNGKNDITPKFDLWGDDNNNNNNKPKSNKNVNENKKNNKNKSTKLEKDNNDAKNPGIGGCLAGIAPSHTQKVGKSTLSSSTTTTTTTTTTTMAALKPTSPSISIDVAKSGQSYNPDHNAHQKVLQDAVAIELKRNEAEKEKKAPISAGMSAETRALLIGDSSSEDEDDDDDEDNDNDEQDNSNNNNNNNGLIEKKKEKLTRAQRNKQKRLRAEEAEIRERKRQKKLMNTVGEAKTITKQLRKEEQTRMEEKERIEKLKEEKNSRIKGTNVLQHLADENPINVPTLPVALPSDLKNTSSSSSGGGGGGSSLRTMKPKGSLITDRMTSFFDRNMATKKQLKKRLRVQGKRRKAKVRVRGKGHDISKAGAILG